ncbi:DUF2993 domain-containing protein [Streptomyces lunaelactis]|uniref:LmeA family phospholipid-binding protein n=1 Tax=Streptomyces lunaelactis TaxID=1535768 RepID=UPI001585413E|nr:DUF2993 domain-containing protein [Streptomyces lunaelactis]NUK00871.1 DUF2993 domain-containing protein [Streptomyces lunaelactis]NUK07403.1 DUF2993 domain-containing protein [Streptomyces lunaelactis]NUK14772.1 DUF2993 domain-containing protein [Streptomyces lunaelactis]NUK22153.1 DUF2993 domain-containing protein [Streptomyces lunaelactis]NUK34168.1 DUF2993 domain-containing protein [Streptomyces lunaelactis]
MRPPTRISAHSRNPYDELAQLADPEPDFSVYNPRDPLELGLTSDPDDDDWAPPDHRGRSRFAALPAVVKLVAAVVMCTVTLLIADRLAEFYAQTKAAAGLQKSLGLATRPDVDIHGFPFLTQVLDERIDRVDVTVPDVSADRVSLAEVRATAKDVRIVGDAPTSIKGAVIGKLDGEVLLSFDDLNRELGASQLRFTGSGADAVRVNGELVVAGQDLRVRAQAHIQRDNERALTTTLDGMQLDIPKVATYRPGKDPEHSGLRLHREAAERISREGARLKALLAVPAVIDRLGVPEEQVRRALRSEEELNRLTNAPKFIERLMTVNLVDVVIEHPQLLRKAGIDPRLVEALLALRPPELSERLSLSFELPDALKELRLQHITVERDGIRARVVGSGLSVGQSASAGS